MSYYLDTACSKKIWFSIVVQNLAKLEEYYKKWSIFSSNFSIAILMSGTKNGEELNYFSGNTKDNERDDDEVTKVIIPLRELKNLYSDEKILVQTNIADPFFSNVSSFL